MIAPNTRARQGGRRGVDEGGVWKNHLKIIQSKYSLYYTNTVQFEDKVTKTMGVRRISDR